ncbi:hypothetical protein T439DRAFT_29602 [Meredithblackwellia eburnea MCA 4105]
MNLNCTEPGEPFYFMSGFGFVDEEVAVYVKQPEYRILENKLAKRQGTSKSEYWRYFGTYKGRWTGPLCLTDLDTNTSTPEQREALISSIVAYGESEIGRRCLGFWNFSPATIEGPPDERRKSAVQDLWERTDDLELTFTLFTYAGYDEDEREWVERRRQYRLDFPVEYAREQAGRKKQNQKKKKVTKMRKELIAKAKAGKVVGKRSKVKTSVSKNSRVPKN